MWNDFKACFQMLVAGVATDERGQALVEYALIIALVAAVLVGSLVALEGGIAGAFTAITTGL